MFDVVVLNGWNAPIKKCHIRKFKLIWILHSKGMFNCMCISNNECISMRYHFREKKCMPEYDK